MAPFIEGGGIHLRARGAPPATPRDARAWRMRASARRTSRLARMAISTREDRVGSLKVLHHSTSSTGLVLVLLGWPGDDFWPFQVSGTLVSGRL